MMTTRGLVAVSALTLFSFAGVAASAVKATDAGAATRGLVGDPISEALVDVTDDVRVYNDHLTTLASPWMEGRVPGSEGMERARDYCEYYLQRAGCEPAFPAESDGVKGEAFSSFRDPFGLGGTYTIDAEDLVAVSGKGTVAFDAETDFVFTGLGGSGKAAGRAVFVGYSIDNGPDGYSSYAEGDDLTGKIAVLFRFEPMNEDGSPKWAEQGWSDRASFANKLRAVAERNAAAAIVINPPGSGDQRAGQLDRFNSGGGAGEFPVFIMSPEGGEKLMAAADPKGRSLLDFRKMADEKGGIVELDAVLTVQGEGHTERLQAENVGGIMRGTGDLADEWVVVGAHLDHLGMGYFGSRSGPGALHPGADDNASGSAGVLLLAQKLKEKIAAMPADQPRRSVLLMLFDGEESGLNGSRHYVQDPIVPIDQHVLMMNWDMIGRIEEERVSVAGLDTGEGMREFFTPLFEGSGLDVRAGKAFPGASDHTSFYRQNMPVIFGSIDGLHADYHTPQDTSDKINRVGATKTVLLFTDMVAEFMVRPEAFDFVQPSGAGIAAGPEMNIKVRMGVMPGSYSEEDPGIPIAGVSQGGPAEKAGLQAGDRLVRWDGQKIGDVESWMGFMAKHNPGDEVKVGVIRNGEEITLTVKLEGR